MVGRGNLNVAVNSDLWVHGTVAYTGMFDHFGLGISFLGIATNALQVWDVSNPATPRLVGSLEVDGVDAVNDVMIRADGTLGVITHDALDGFN